MIQIIEGKGVGAGKSYFVIELLMQHWSRGGTAYVSESFCVEWDECKKLAERRYGLHLEDDQYHEVRAGDIWRLHENTPPGSEDCPLLIVVDEAQDQLGAREWNATEKKDLFSWCCQSRHDDNDLLFVSQSSLNIDARIRRLATFTWSVRNMRHFSIPGLGNFASAVKLFTFGLNDGFYFARTLLDYDGKTALERKFLKVDRSLLKCYRSKSMRQTKKRLGAPVGRKNLKKSKTYSPMIKYIVLLVVILAAFSVYKFSKEGMFGGLDKPTQAAPVQQVTKGGTVSAAASKAVMTYEVQHSNWLSQGKHWLKTATGTYVLNRMSKDGYVEGIADDVVRVRKPDGGLLFVVGDAWNPPVTLPSPTSTPVVRMTVAPIATPAPTANMFEDSTLGEREGRFQDKRTKTPH